MPTPAPAPAGEGPRAAARSAVLRLLESAGFEDGSGGGADAVLPPPPPISDGEDERTRQILACSGLVASLELVRLQQQSQQQKQQQKQCQTQLKGRQPSSASAAGGDENDPPASNAGGDHRFIRTSMDYNNTSCGDGAAETVAAAGVRDALPGLPPAAMSNLPMALSSLLSDRVDPETLNPAARTLAGGALAAEMEDPAKRSRTLSPLALEAGRAYAELIGMAGSWGAGLIDVGTMAALAALVRRWSVECRGREPGAIEDGDGDDGGADGGSGGGRGRKGGGKKKKKGRKRNGSKDADGRTKRRRGGVAADATRKRKADEERGSGEDRPLRRSRRAAVVAKLSDSEGEEGANSSSEEEEEDDEAQQPDASTEEIRAGGEDRAAAYEAACRSEREMVAGGLRLALSLARVPVLPEFVNWSAEAREALLDAAVSALACASALLAAPSRQRVHRFGEGGSFARGSGGPEEEGEVRSLCEAAVDALTESLGSCLSLGELRAPPPAAKTPSRQRSERKESSDGESTTEVARALDTAQETAIFVLRGLLPLLSFHVELPMGQKGRAGAHGAATAVLERIIDSVSSEAGRCDSILARASAGREPHRLRGKGNGGGAAKTPKRSLGGEGTGEDATTPTSARRTPRTGGTGRRRSIGLLSPVPPSLKKTVTPGRGRKHTPGGAATEEPTSAPSDGRPRPILIVLLGLMQKMATARGLERAQARSRAAATIKCCLPRFPALEQSHFLRFVTQLCHSKVAFHRLFAVEIIGEFLADGWIWRHCSSSASTGGESAAASPGRDPNTMSPALREIMTEPSIPVALLKALHDRLSDRAPAVRARAAHSLSDALNRITMNHAEGNGEDVTMIDTNIENNSTTAFRDSVIAMAPQLVSTLRRRAALDERATVRKASVAGLTSLLLVTNAFVGDCDVIILSRLCGDPSVATRKAAAESLTTLLQKEYEKSTVNPLLESAFAEAVLPLVLDVETSCVTKAVDSVSAIILNPIIEVGGRKIEWHSDLEKNRYMTAWRVLAQVSRISNESGATKGGTRSLKAILRKVFDDAGTSHASISKPLLRELHRMSVSSLDLENEVQDMEIFTDNSHLFAPDTEAGRVGAWCLLDAVTDFGTEKKGSSTLLEGEFVLSKAFKASSIDFTFLSSSWKKLHEICSSTGLTHQKVATTLITSRQCLQLMSRLGSKVSLSEAKRSEKHLHLLLASFDLTPDLVGPAISALIALTKRLCDDESSTMKDVHDAYKVWVMELYSICEAKLESFVKSIGRGLDCEISHVERAIFTVGELSMVGFATDEDARLLMLKKYVATEDHPARGLRVRPSSRLVTLVKIILPSHLPPVDDCNPLSTPQTARALAFVTLGKLCLRDESLAKDCLNILARELNFENGDNDPSVQSNVLLVLGDLCIRYTNLVDKFLPTMASCLQTGCDSASSVSLIGPGSSLVRKHAVLLLSSLVLQDYIKWRGLLVHRFLAACVDDDIEVAHLARTTLCGPLLSKQPNLFFNNFVEALFVFNNCTAHKIFAAAQSNGESGSGIGVDFQNIRLSKRQRMQIYRMMLGFMSDEEKIGITARLAKEVLAGALEIDSDLRASIEPPPQNAIANGTGNEQRRREKAFQVMSDCFAVLADPCARVGRSTNNEAEEVEEAATDGPSAAQLSAVRGRLLSKISRKHLIDTGVPILCRMKTILEKSRSPLLKDLMLFFVEIYKMNKGEVKGLLASDPGLMQEIEFDLKQFEKQQKVKRVMTPESKNGTNVSLDNAEE